MKVDYSQSHPLSQRREEKEMILSTSSSPKIQYHTKLRHETII